MPRPRRAAEHASTGETVLVVEDEPVVRGVILEMLAEQGYRTREAVDGPSGLNILRSDAPIDLLVTDVGLPGMNGRQLADQARELRPGLKVLFITGYAESAAISPGFLQAGHGNDHQAVRPRPSRAAHPRDGFGVVQMWSVHGLHPSRRAQGRAPRNP